MDSAAKIPLSHTLWSPHDTVKDAADLLGVTLPDDAAKNLAMDVEYRIHEILETAIKFMRHSKRKLLVTGDINNALKVLNIEPLFGYDQSQPLVFKEALSGAGGQTLYYIDDNEIEFEKLINQELPKVPRQTTFTAHWLGIEGVQPMIPQNPLASEIKNLPSVVRGATSSVYGNDLLSSSAPGSSSTEESKDGNGRQKSKKGDKDVEVKPLVKHVLSKELKLYFDKIVEVLISTDPEKETFKDAALNSLRTDPGLHQLVPYFIQFVAEQVTNQLRNIELLITLLEVISALCDNKTIFLDPYVHALMPCILTLLLAKRIGPVVPENADDDAVIDIIKGQFAVREFASLLLQHIIDSFGSSYTTLKPRVTRTLLRALLDSSKPLGTHYGALLGIEKLGSEVIKLVLVGNVKMWSKQVVEDSSKRSVETNILKQKVLDVLEKLKIEDKFTENDSDKMDVDQEVSTEIKEKLKDRIGEPLADDLLQKPDAKAICRGIFIGEANV
ncbi:hypothetical protein FT663_00483 [Candidozyma haemuli var. vulneris]|uniref:TBP-associated factor 6 n=1 Tax=Candidozyma haemuli TaxID=45357 RepID=A0A2V1AU58_9ASCO|nr:hypothetical protein CXQ85_002252 [[Candida] haemuloni]KAF3993460.1 hypothetical protein FT662_00589 [[Candida] haemuloni var. vulneris]KAF3995430.1 hypothetical protein FT663_00483 [[Candida] haemuloni var. vulneris]PVH20461.1 hypothetical protein CXQ85_002252 [[Candida] haemuloni]